MLIFEIINKDKKTEECIQLLRKGIKIAEKYGLHEMKETCKAYLITCQMKMQMHNEGVKKGEIKEEVKKFCKKMCMLCLREVKNAHSKLKTMEGVSSKELETLQELLLLKSKYASKDMS